MRCNVPDIYIVGAQKSGTTTLFDWIAQHPAIYADPLAKDYPYFSNNQTYHDGPQRFHSFARGTFNNSLLALGGEANAMYAPLAPQRMQEVMPDTRLIAILRNPVDRAFSAYCYAVERLLENRSLAQAIEDELNGLKYSPQDALQRDYLAHGHYARQLESLYQFFDTTRVKIIAFEKLKQEPVEVMQEIFQYVGLSMFEPKMSIKNQTQGGCRSRLLVKITHTHPSSKLVRNLGRMLIPFSFRVGIRRKLVTFNRIDKLKPEFPDHVRKQLYDYYRKEISALQLLIGQDFSEWCK